MNRLILVAAALCVLTVAGCGAKATITKGDDSTYIVHKEDHAGIFGSMARLKTEVEREADEFAEKEGKQVVHLAEREHPVGIFGDWAWYELKFKLYDPRTAQEAQACFDTLKSDPSLQPIAGKVALGGPGDQTFSMLADSEKPTSAEQGALRLWGERRSICWRDSIKSDLENGTPKSLVAVRKTAWSTSDELLVSLIAGQITFGDFARLSKQISDSTFTAETKIRAELRTQEADAQARAERIAIEANKANAQQMSAFFLGQAMLNSSRPAPVINSDFSGHFNRATTTNCQRIGNAINCTTQ